MPLPLQKAIFCPCGTPAPPRAALCHRCRQQQTGSRRRFGGLRTSIRDRYRYAARGSAPPRLHVHHRKPGWHQRACLLTFCPRCHARAHKFARLPRLWLPPLLIRLWQAQHPGAPLQLQLAFWEEAA